MNRKQRRAAASKKGQKRMQKISPQDVMIEKLERVQRLVAGKMEPPNEFCAYLVQQIQQASAEADNVQKNLQQHRETAAKLENRAKELRGVINKYIQDVQQWDKPAKLPGQTKEDTPQEASEPEAAKPKEAEPVEAKELEHDAA